MHRLIRYALCACSILPQPVVLMQANFPNILWIFLYFGSWQKRFIWKLLFNACYLLKYARYIRKNLQSYHIQNNHIQDGHNCANHRNCKHYSYVQTLTICPHPPHVLDVLYDWTTCQSITHYTRAYKNYKKHDVEVHRR